MLKFVIKFFYLFVYIVDVLFIVNIFLINMSIQLIYFIYYELVDSFFLIVLFGCFLKISIYDVKNIFKIFYIKLLVYESNKEYLYEYEI